MLKFCIIVYNWQQYEIKTVGVIRCYFQCSISSDVELFVMSVLKRAIIKSCTVNWPQC